MARLGRRVVTVAAAALGMALLGYELLPRDETRIGALLDALCSELNQTRDDASLAVLRTRLREVLKPEVRIQIDESAEAVDGVDAVIARSRELVTGLPLSFVLSAVEVHLSGRLARVDADLSVTVRGSAEQHRDLRRTQVRLVKSGADWRIEALEVGAVPPAEPEARP